MPVALGRGERRALRRIDEQRRAAGPASARRPAAGSLATIVRTPRAFSMQITARPIGPQPITIATSRFFTSPRRTACQATAIGSVSALTSGASPFGTAIIIDSCTSICWAYPPGAAADSPIASMPPRALSSGSATTCAAGRDPPIASRSVLAHHAAELVPEHDPLGRAHEAVVAGLGGTRRRARRSDGARAGPSRTRRSAAPRSAPGPAPATGRCDLDQLEPSLRAGDRLHCARSPSDSPK